MEFGIFIQRYTRRSGGEEDPDEASTSVAHARHGGGDAADKAGFKYVWVTEHHFLDEYSHLSANDVVGVPRQRDRAHPFRFGDLQPVAAGEPSGQGGRAGRDAGPPVGGPVRVRHGPGGGQPRDLGVLARMR